MKRVFFVVFCLCIFILSGCTDQLLESIDTQYEDQLMTQLFNSFEDQDYTFAKEVMSDYIFESGNAEDSFAQISDYIDGHVETYKKIGYNFYTTVSDDTSTNSIKVTYEVATDKQEYAVMMILISNEPNVYEVNTFYVITAEEFRTNGAVINFNKLDMTQLLLLIYSAACFGLIIYAIIACAKSKIRLKGLWIVLIVLINSGISITNSVSLNSYKLILFNTDISSLRKYLDGSTILTVLLPIGAILFLCLKKRLIASAKKYYEQKSAILVTPETMPEVCESNNTVTEGTVIEDMKYVDASSKASDDENKK